MQPILTLQWIWSDNESDQNSYLGAESEYLENEEGKKENNGDQIL